jgi:hypothetical protein
MDLRSQPVRFEIAGVEAEDPLGLWVVASESVVHFGMEDESAAPPADTPVYRIQLPEDSAAAEAAFGEREARLQQSAQVLESIPSRLDDLVARTQVRQKVAESQAVHFGIDELGTGEDAAESELLNLIADVDTGGASAPAAGKQVEFGIVDEAINPALERAQSQFNALLEQVNREVLHFAWVETATLGQTLARTGVDWSGDAETVWMNGISLEQSALHNRALRFATHSRALKMRLFMTITGGAAKVAALMTNPAGAALALPVVYRYVSQMLTQARELNALKAGIPNPSA